MITILVMIVLFAIVVNRLVWVVVRTDAVGVVYWAALLSRQTNMPVLTQTWCLVRTRADVAIDVTSCDCW